MRKVLCGHVFIPLGYTPRPLLTVPDASYTTWAHRSRAETHTRVEAQTRCCWSAETTPCGALPALLTHRHHLTIGDTDPKGWSDLAPLRSPGRRGWAACWTQYWQGHIFSWAETLCVTEKSALSVGGAKNWS